MLILTKIPEDRRKKETKGQSSADIDEEEQEEVIRELEKQGDLDKDVPEGGEEFENEEPRQG